jgi:cytochrome-b5 reductase
MFRQFLAFVPKKRTLFITGVAAAGALSYLAFFRQQAFAATTPSLSSSEFTPLKLAKKQRLTHNVQIYTFAYASPDETLDFPVASFILSRADCGEKEPTIRPYTPITYNTKGSMDLAIKTYPNGKMSKRFESMKVGDTMDFKGPLKKFDYSPNMKKKIGLIAGGTGITPMMQIIHKIVTNPKDKTEVFLIFGNVSEDDIMLKDRLDEWAKKYKNLKIYYTVDKPTKSWKQGSGFVNADMVAKNLPKPQDDALIFVCGPDPMYKAVCGEKGEKGSQGEIGGVLKEMGYKKEQVVKL